MLILSWQEADDSRKSTNDTPKVWNTIFYCVLCVVLRTLLTGVVSSPSSLHNLFLVTSLCPILFSLFSFLFKVLKFSLWWCYTKYYKSIFLLVLPWKNVMVLWLSECFLDFIIHVWNLSLSLCCVLRQVTFLSQCLSLPKKETFYGWSQIKRCSGLVCALNSGLRGLSSRPGWVTVLFS